MPAEVPTDRRQTELPGGTCGWMDARRRCSMFSAEPALLPSSGSPASRNSQAESLPVDLERGRDASQKLGGTDALRWSASKALH